MWQKMPKYVGRYVKYVKICDKNFPFLTQEWDC